MAGAATTQDRDLTLSPLRTELAVAPGTAIDGVLKVSNRTPKSMNVTLSAEVFRVTNEQYDYAFSEDSDAAKWIRFDQDTIELSSGEEKTVEYQLAAPLKAEPGGRYISLFASANTESDSATVPSRQRVASLLYITVQGEVTRTGQFLGLDMPWLTTKDSVWSTRIRNGGTTHFRSRYSIVMKTIGGEIVSEQREDALILPGTVRLVSDTLRMPRWPGLYQLDYKIGLGDSPSHRESRWIFFSPPLFTVSVLALLLFGGATAYMLRQKLRR